MEERYIYVVIKEPAFINYTGFLCGTEFKNGRSLEPLHINDAIRLGASSKVETVDGTPITPFNRQQVIKETRDLVGSNDYQCPKDQHDEVAKNSGHACAAPEPELAPTPDPEVVEVVDDTQAETTDRPALAPVIYSREELEAVADNDGIRGLREVADGFGVKGRSIEELISEILEYQARA